MRKLTHFCASVVLLVMFLSVNAHSGDPVVPLVEIRADMADVYEIPQEMADQMINEMEGRIPSAGRVGVPMPAGARYLGGGRMQEMEYANLVSRDTPEALMVGTCISAVVVQNIFRRVSIGWTQKTREII